MKTLYLKKKLNYDGSQLRSHWIFEETGILGDALVAFTGGCFVKPEYMVDMIDLKGKKRIFSEEMLHFIGEFFRRDIEHAVLIQHLLVSIIGDEISKSVPSAKIRRLGNDLFDGRAKINISIATVSRLSALIHIGVNISDKNTPVLTKGLRNYKISPRNFALNVLKSFSRENSIIEKSICKARTVE